MAYSTPPSLVPGVQREQLPYGLFSVAVPREGSNARFENGILFEGFKAPSPSEGVLIGTYKHPEDNEENPTTGLPKSAKGERTESEGEEFTVYAMNECSPIGNSLEDGQRLAVEELVATEQSRVEYELWTGSVRDQDGLNDLATFYDSSENLKKVVAGLEGKFSWEYGSQGVLHVSRRVASLLSSYRIVESRGGKLYTGLGTPVVAGAGYGYPSTANTLIITPPLVIYRSEIFEATNRAGDLLDRKQNELYAIAERTYTIGIDVPDHIYKSEFLEEPEGAV